MQPEQLHETAFLRILWDEKTRIIGIDWKESTATMTDEDFKADLTLFAGYVERKKAQGILVEVSKFHHQMAPDVQPWWVKNIASRYSAAGVRRFAYLLANHLPIPPTMNESSPGESFTTRAFNDYEEATAWLTVGE